MQTWPARVAELSRISKKEFEEALSKAYQAPPLSSRSGAPGRKRKFEIDAAFDKIEAYIDQIETDLQHAKQRVGELEREIWKLRNW